MDTLSYKDTEIAFEKSVNPRITIDGEPTQVSWDPDAEEYDAGELPYCSFASIEELAKAIVDERLSRADERAGNQ